MYAIGRILSFLTKSASWLGAICVVLMMLHVTFDVAGRYFLNTPLPGTIVVVAHYYMIILVFIGIGVAEEKNGHVTVDVFTDMLPPKAQTGFGVFGGLVTAAVICMLMIGGWTAAVKKTSNGATMEQGSRMIEIWQSYWAIPVGAALMLLLVIYRLFITLTGARSGLDEATAKAEFFND